jgi:hypothetical protein
LSGPSLIDQEADGKASYEGVLSVRSLSDSRSRSGFGAGSLFKMLVLFEGQANPGFIRLLEKPF